MGKFLFLGYEYLYYKKSNSISNILRQRISNLKNIIQNIQKIIFQLHNKYIGPNQDIIVKNYITKFKKIVVNNNNEKLFFDAINIIDSVFFIPIDFDTIITEDNDHIYIGNLTKIINTDDILLEYLNNQFNILLDINDDKYTKLNLAFMITNIIECEYNKCMQHNNALYNIDVKIFMNTSHELQTFTIDDTLIDFIDEETKTDIKNDSVDINIDDINESLDIDIDPDDIDDTLGDAFDISHSD